MKQKQEINELGLLMIKKYMDEGKTRVGTPIPKCQEVLYKRFVTFIQKNGGFTVTDEPIDGTSKRASEIRILPVDPQVYMRKGVPKYVSRGKEMKILKAHYQIDKPTLLAGPSGIGKTLMIDNFAEEEEIPLVRFDCSENTKRTDLIGRFLIIGDETVFQLGILPTAIVVANVVGYCILDFEEINALTGAMQKILNQLLDYRRLVYVDGVGKLYELGDGKKLFICASMNPTGGIYGGTNPLNEDLLARFSVIRFGYPTEAQEKDEIDTTDVPDDIITKLLRLAMESRVAFDGGEIERPISPRDNNAFCELYREYKKISGLDPVLSALNHMIVDKYEVTTHIDWVVQRIQSIFAIKVDDQTAYRNK